MKERLTKCAGLNEAQLARIGQLEQVCNRFEGLTMKLNWDSLRRRPTNEVNDFLYDEGDKLVGYLALYSFNQKEAEVSAMTYPDYRQRGIFKQLLTEARSELEKRGIADFLFICEQASVSGAKCVQAIGAKYDFSEYKMVLKKAVEATATPGLQLRPALAEDIANLIRMDELCFNVPAGATQAHLERDLSNPNRRTLLATVGEEQIGKIQVLLTESETYIFGFCVFPEHRKKGYGRTVLTRTVAQLVTEGHKNIVLEVASDNRNALGLYEDCGFEVSTAYDYYRLAVDR